MISPAGQTRTCIRERHALITPDGHVPSLVPGATGVRTIAHITPALTAGFAQSTLYFDETGQLSVSDTANEHFFYLLEGRVQIENAGKLRKLETGSYCFLPPFSSAIIRAAGQPATVVHFQKRFVPLPDGPPPAFLSGHASDVQGQPFLGNPKALLQVLLPDELGFDLAVNIFTYQPGAALPFVETHVMEHGLLMLGGQGIYRLEDSWYPVAAGDVIWMAPFCPQWFAALGDVPASYIYYKDVNRPLLT